MSLTTREYAYFRVDGSGDYRNVSEIIGREPSSAHSEGEANPRTGKPFRSMVWRFDSGFDDKVPLAQHINLIISWLGSSPEAIKRLSDSYRVTLQCVGYFPKHQFGMHLSRDQIRLLGQMGVEVDMDFYYIDDYEHDTDDVKNW